MSIEMEHPVAPYMPVFVMSFKGEDEVCNDKGLLELTDTGGGFVEIAFDYGEERVYLGFRLSDLLRAVKARNQP